MGMEMGIEKICDEGLRAMAEDRGLVEPQSRNKSLHKFQGECHRNSRIPAQIICYGTVSSEERHVNYRVIMHDPAERDNQIPPRRVSVEHLEM